MSGPSTGASTAAPGSPTRARRDELFGYIRNVPDYPQPGVLFRDITPLLAASEAFTEVVQAMAAPWLDAGIDEVAGIEARGFILAAPVALALGAGFVPVRKQGKLPGPTRTVSYDLEYGQAVLEARADAFRPGGRVLVVDDVLATGGTVAATMDLVRDGGAEIAGVGVLMELLELGGRDRVTGVDLQALFAV